jgi:hypothetical protein
MREKDDLGLEITIPTPASGTIHATTVKKSVVKNMLPLHSHPMIFRAIC